MCGPRLSDRNLIPNQIYSFEACHPRPPKPPRVTMTGAERFQFVLASIPVETEAGFVSKQGTNNFTKFDGTCYNVEPP